MNNKLENIHDNPGVIAPPPLIYAGALVIGLFLHRKLPLRFLPRRWNRFPVSGALIGSAILLLQNAFGQFHQAQTNANPQLPATTVVVEGPYRFTRNPIYLGFTFIYAGIAILVNSFWVIALLPSVLILMRVGVIDREERYLERKFGDQYLRYKANVGRWL